MEELVRGKEKLKTFENVVIGPSRVGKTTLIRLLEQELIARAGERLLREPAHRPFVSINATGPGSGRFDWVDYYAAILRQVNNPFLNRKPSAIRVRDMREAMEEALIQHRPYAVIVDEAHHLAKAASGRTLQDQLDHLKYLENRTGVLYVKYNPSPRRGLTPSTHVRRDRLKKAELFIASVHGELPYARDSLGVLPTGGTTRACTKVADDAEKSAISPSHD
jgi:ABC-type cobalamin/Fe3+-siderophores transport system ATPase subunit